MSDIDHAFAAPLLRGLYVDAFGRGMFLKATELAEVPRDALIVELSGDAAIAEETTAASFAEALASPSTFAGDPSGAGGIPTATAMQRSPSVASLLSVAMEITRDPTASSPGVIEFMAAVLPPDLSLRVVQERMGDLPPAEESLPSIERPAEAPADSAALEALIQIFDEADEEAADRGITVAEMEDFDMGGPSPPEVALPQRRWEENEPLVARLLTRKRPSV